MDSNYPVSNPIRLQVMANALAGIAEEMGARLIRGSYSANIKERRDCSTALFDAQGACIAQAAHIPVHLGALSQAVRAVVAANPRPGDVFVLNDPYQGGSHLPDVTVVAAIPGWRDPDRICAYAVNRAHHADIGGMRPGSMPADSTELWQEGLVIPPVRLAGLSLEGELYWQEDLLRLILANVRNAEQRRGDLQAQVGASAVGMSRFRELLARFGEEEAWQLIAGVIEYSRRRMRAQIQALPDGIYTAEDWLEGYGDPPAPLEIRVQVEVEGEKLRVDFTGTAPAMAGNLNAPLAVTRSAVLFALRCLLDPTAPSNVGLEDPIEIVAPPGCLVNAQFPAAVVAGNVETSQRIADVVFKALAPVAGLRSIAQGQGTMNNCVLGNRHFTYYETLGGWSGGQPATTGFGRSACGHEQYPQHPHRGSGAGVSPAGTALRATPGFRRPWPTAGRLGANPLHPDFAGLHPLPAHRAAPLCPPRRTGRRARPSGDQPPQRGSLAWQNQPLPKSRRRDHPLHAGRRGLGLKRG